MTTVVADASAVLAVLGGEPGAERAAELNGALISTVNASEVLAKLADRGIPPPVGRIAMEGLGLAEAVFDSRHAQRAAELRGRTRALGISLGDRACLALALTQAARVMTADRTWSMLDLGIEIDLIR